MRLTCNNQMNETDIAKLISYCRSGSDEIAIERLVKHYQAGVFRLALSILDDESDANEATQDAFIAALGALESYRDDSSFKAWLYTITLNLCRSRLRKRKALIALGKTLQSIFKIQTQKIPSPEEIIIRGEQDAKIWQALEKLGERHRLPVILRYYNNLATAEIAEILSINEGTVRSRLHTAHERLRAVLGDQE
jgi:RNA polymerase sigma-70 factor (ECF subfamily)